MTPPTITDVHRAANGLRGRLAPTPLLSYPALDEITGTRVLVKHENLQPTGAFKVRGGLTLLAGMDPAERERGVVGYSTGNHAQSLAYAAREFGVPCLIVMPEAANPVKARAVRRLGAELVTHGPDFEAATAHAHELARDRGMRLVGAADEPGIIAGVATAYLEILTAAPDLSAIVVPVGSGTGAAAACLVAAAVNPACRIVAVQSESSPAGYESWRSGTPERRPNRTAVEGLATGSGFALPQSMLRDRLHDFRLVTDDRIARAQWMMLSRARTVAEGAGAAALAAVLDDPEDFSDGPIAIVCTGGNAAEAELRRCVALASSTEPGFH
ncbi:threonine dehydratase [Stackebrandtia albiflava]|uniref:threonine ammonia-lyase n=1 Tax=Stackebrandtia albiflava TaxID=406432 RepID=A0A562V9S7_9ACTN|nr:pyridoxal-phosphate dependent enzyme [Stackebrandtia albiflava]TWJ14634.1 threonine dehydratase [Stackebrandtia albiflava]